jgi:hypothetical protein
VSEKITPETRQQVMDMFPELHEICHRSVRPNFFPKRSRPLATPFF